MRHASGIRLSKANKRNPSIVELKPKRNCGHNKLKTKRSEIFIIYKMKDLGQ